MGSLAVSARASLSPREKEIIGTFVLAAEGLGIPRSVGEIYGLIFVSEQPVTLNRIVERLRISKGSASQGLRFLRAIGAVKPLYQPGERSAQFGPELELRVLLAGLLRERVLPYLSEGRERLECLSDLPAESISPHLETRLAKLRAWHDQAGQLLPLFSQFLG